MENRDDQIIINARKELLIKIDEKKGVTQLEKGLLGLTSYYEKNKTNKLNKSIYEMKLDINNESRPIEHLNGELYFMPEQYDILNQIDKYDRLLISAPTSFGKSLLIKEYIYKSNHNSIAYIVPTNSLAYELENFYKQSNSFKNYRIFDSKKTDGNDEDFKDNNTKEKFIFIGTQEKYMEMSKDIEIDLMVIDEAYKLQEKTSNQRNYILSSVFLDFINEGCKKMILLSPCGNFVGFDDYEFKILKTNFNAVDRIFTEVEKDEFRNKLIEEAQKDKTILFCESPNRISQYTDIDITFEINFSNILKELIEDVDEEWSVVKFLKKGIIVNHGAMPKYLQNKLLKMYIDNKELKLLIGTNSISEGINTPTRNIFIDPSYKTKKNKMIVQNTIGRAGRLGEYPIGRIFGCNLNIEKIMNHTEIKLSISNEKEREEVDKNIHKNNIKELCKDRNLEYEIIVELSNKYSFSYNVIKSFLDFIKKEVKKFGDASKLLGLPSVGRVMEDNHLYINGILNAYYKEKPSNNNIYFNNFKNKISYIKNKNKDKKIPSTTDIIDNYMKMRYSIIEYDIKPYVDFYYDLKDSGIKLEVGKNVDKSFEDFRKKYNEKIIGRKNYDELSEDEKKILSRLREYGISATDIILPNEALKLLNDGLNVRYSMYDIRNQINKLSSNTKYGEKFRKIHNKYF